MKYEALFNISRYGEDGKEIWRVQAGETFDETDVLDIADLLASRCVKPVPPPAPDIHPKTKKKQEETVEV